MGTDEHARLNVERYRTFESRELRVGQRVQLDPMVVRPGERIFEFGTVQALRDGSTVDVLLEQRRNPYVRITALGVRVRAICGPTKQSRRV